MDQDATCYGGRPLPSRIVLDGDPSPTPQKNGAQQSPQLLAYVCCGHMAGSIKVPFGTDVSLGPRDILNN